jgi:hypothetical protein
MLLPRANKLQNAAANSYAEVGAVYAGLVAEKPVKGSTGEVDNLAVPPLKTGPPRRLKEEGT